MNIKRLDEPPRRQHYYFAHVYLRDRAFERAKATVDQLRRESGTQYLKTLWVTRGLAGKEEEDEFISPDGLECSPFEIGDDYYGVLIQFPKPERMTEAYFAAMILPVNAEHSAQAEYYTLELTINMDGSEGTVLGMWQRGSHFSLVAKSEPNKEAFLQAINSLISGRGKN